MEDRIREEGQFVVTTFSFDHGDKPVLAFDGELLILTNMRAARGVAEDAVAAGDKFYRIYKLEEVAHNWTSEAMDRMLQARRSQEHA